MDNEWYSSYEALWRLFDTLIHDHFSPVEQLAVHLENRQRVVFKLRSPVAAISHADS
jgi:hypothetical protein